MKRLALLVALTLAAPTWAEPPETAPRPAARPDGMAQQIQEAQQVMSAPRPPARPAAVADAGRRAAEMRARGAVCGNVAIQGETIARIGTPGSGCGVADPVQVTSVAGVRLSPPARIDCTTAQALLTWVERSVQPSFARRGGGVAGLEIMGSYSCRTRNSQPGARLSEHAKGRALDIGGLTLRDGTRVSVLRDWGRGWQGDGLANVRRQACGIFGTVLGPGVAYHDNHFHFDTARYRSGSYCR